MSVLALTSGSPMWYLARGTGIAALVLLTVSVVLGIVTSVRWSVPRWPRFVIEHLHRDVTLVVLALIALHVVTVVVDSFAPIGFLAAVVPLSSPYRPVWLGLGALGVDLLLAIAITSWLRHRVGFRIWRFVHWFAYGSWAVAMLHGLGTGSDTRQAWALIVYAACLAVVVSAVWWRLSVGWERATGVRLVALAATFVLPLALLGWMKAGPLRNGWARRSGTPASVLAKVAQKTAGTTSANSNSTNSPNQFAPAPSSDDSGGSG